MKKLFLGMAALVAMVATSCVQTEELAVANNKEAIGFDTFVENVTKTLYDNSNLTYFNVYGTITADNGGLITNIFPGVEVSNTTGVWAYGSQYTQYWIPGFTYNFAAVVDGDVDVDATTGMPTTISTDMTAQNDVLYSTVSRHFGTNDTAAKVSFQFAHLLSKAKFTVKNGIVNGQDFVYNVESITIKNADKDAEYEVATGEWTATNTYEASFGEILSIGQQEQKGNTTEVLLVPGTKELAIEIAYNLTYKTTILKQETKELTAVLTLAKGNAYNFVVEFGNPGEDIKFDAVVDTWVEGNYDVNGTSVVATVEEFTKAFASEGINNIVLDDNIVLDGTTRSTVYSLIVASGRTLTLDLNGHTLSGNWHKDNGAIIKNEGTLTVVNGTISSLGENGGSAIQNSGTMIVTNATLNGAPNANGSWPSYTVNNTGNSTLNNVKVTSYHGAVASYGENAVVTLNDSEIDMSGIPGFTSHGIYTYNSGKVVVNGGKYANKATDQTSSGASVINGAVTVNSGNFSGRLENYYGTPVLKGGSYTVDPTRFLAEGYKAVGANGKYVVVADDVDVDAVVSTPAEIKAAIGVANQTVCVMPTADGSAHLLEGKMNLAEGVSLIGMGDEPVALFNDWGSNAFGKQAHFTNTTVENINFTNNLVIDAGIANGNVHFKNCVFGGALAHQGVHFDSGNATIVFDNCTFVGRNMLGASLTKVIFNNCTFLNKKSSQTAADLWTGVNMWGKYEFNNCEFDTEATCNVKCDGVEATFTNCKYTDNRNIEEVVNNYAGYPANIIIDGELLPTPVSTTEQFTDALSAGGSISLQENIDVTMIDLTNLANDVIIDANGKTIKTASNYGVKVAAGKNITLKNAKVEMTVEGNYITYAAGFKIENGDYEGNTITLKNCEIRMCNTDWAYPINMPASVKNLNLVIDGCTLEGAIALQCWGDNNTITATNSHFICNYTTSAMYTSYCVVLQGDGTYKAENNTLNIRGCEFSYSGVDNFNSVIKAVADVSGARNNTITVVDCTYNNKVAAY